MLELSRSIVLTAGNVYGGGANVEGALLMVAAMWWLDVEVEFDVNGIGGKEVVVAVGMW